jgi:hypothetical protein
MKYDATVLFICYGTPMEHRSLLNRSGICGRINRCNICLVHAAVLSVRTAFNLVNIHLLFRIILTLEAHKKTKTNKTKNKAKYTMYRTPLDANKHK